jgi:hypothetical protein
MQSAAKALLDGYNNESVSSWSTALERAQEFWLRVVFRARHADLVAFETAWRDVASQSERQFGAFHLLYVLETGTVLKLHDDVRRIRNSAVHRGRIIEEGEAIRFADLVFERIRLIENHLRNAYAEVSALEAAAEVAKQRTLVRPSMEFVTLKPFGVKIDNDNNVVGFPETLNEYLALTHHAMKTGFA